MINILLSILFLYLPFQIAINPVEGIDMASIRLIIPIIFLLWLIQGLKNKKIFIPNTKTTALLLSFLFLSSFSLLIATNIEWGIRKLLFILSILPLYFVAADRNNNEMLTILKFLTWGAFLAALIGIFQFSLQFIFGINKALFIWSQAVAPFLGNSFSEAVLENSSWLVNVSGATLFRAVSFFPDPHMFSFYLGMSAPIALAIYFRIKNNKNLYLIYFFVILLADFLTFSRGGYLGIIVGLFFGIIIFQKKYFEISKKQINQLLIIMSLLFITIILFVFVPSPVSNRLYSSFNLSEGSNSERIEIWSESLKIIYKNPLIGVGLGNYSLSIKPSAEYREPIYSHATYLDIAAETGIFNALLWIFILLLSILNATRIFYKKNNILYLGLASSLVVFSTHSLFETAIFSVHILPLLILVIGLINNKEAHEENI